MTADLPFLRTSERKAFKRCPMAWKWRYIDWWVPRRVHGGALWFGTGIHLALEHWYIPGKKRGRHPVETWLEYVGDRVEHIKTLITEGEKADGEQTWFEDAAVLGTAMLQGYVDDEYGDDDEWEVISPEQTAMILIPHPSIKGLKVARQVATFDLVARNLKTGKIWLWDHKTAASIVVSHLWGDDQAGAYWAIAPDVLIHQGKMKKGERLAGILYNFLMKSKRDDRPENEDGLKTNQPKKEHYVRDLQHHYGSDNDMEMVEAIPKMSVAKLKELAKTQNLEVIGDVSEKQPAKRFHREPVYRSVKERRTQVRRIGEEVMWMEAMRNGDMPVIKNPSDKCNFCEFRALCELDEKGGDTQEYLELEFTKEDPYAAHRKAA